MASEGELWDLSERVEIPFRVGETGQSRQGWTSGRVASGGLLEPGKVWDETPGRV